MIHFLATSWSITGLLVYSLAENIKVTFLNINGGTAFHAISSLTTLFWRISRSFSGRREPWVSVKNVWVNVWVNAELKLYILEVIGWLGA